MYFPDDPLFFQDPIYQAVPEQSRHALVSIYDHDTTTPEWALGFRFDIVLRGRSHAVRGALMAAPLTLTPSQTVGPFLHIALAETAKRFAVAAESAGRSASTERSPTAPAWGSPTA